MIKKVFKTIKVILTVFVIAVLGVLIIQRVTNNKVNFMGFGMYTVISESMMPEYEIGDIFVSKTVEKNDIKVGDDLVYLGAVDDYKDKVITHRVIKIDNKIHTKGINNPLEDPEIEYDQVYGKVVTRLPLLSIFSKMMNNDLVFYTVIFVPFTILVFFDIKAMIEDKRQLELEKNQETEEEPKEE